jgi:hypothetical protein
MGKKGMEKQGKKVGERKNGEGKYGKANGNLLGGFGSEASSCQSSKAECEI